MEAYVLPISQNCIGSVIGPGQICEVLCPVAPIINGSSGNSLRRRHYWTRWVMKIICFWASSEKVWLQWIQNFAKFEFRICNVWTGCFWALPYILDFPEFTTHHFHDFAQTAPCLRPGLDSVARKGLMWPPTGVWPALTALYSIMTGTVKARVVYWFLLDDW